MGVFVNHGFGEARGGLLDVNGGGWPEVNEEVWLPAGVAYELEREEHPCFQKLVCFSFGLKHFTTNGEADLVGAT